MAPGSGVVDAFKNLIRHGKHHNNAKNEASKSDREDSLPNSPRASQQQQQQQQAILQKSAAKQQQQQQQELHHQLQQHEQQQQQQRQRQPEQPAEPSPEAREIAEQIVNEEREEMAKMPVYDGLEGFKLVEKMGDGAFSNVYKAIDLTTGKKVAVKVVRKYELNASQRANILKEVQIMRGTNHPSIVKLISFSESPEHYFLVLELMEGGELFHQIVKLTYFSENLARHVILQVATGIRYLHEERGVVHRDIKPENLLFSPIPIIPSRTPVLRPYDEDKEDEGEFIPGVGGGGIGRVKIADFGLSKVVWNEETMTPCGTVGYTAPEIVKDERYSKSVDMWALGCVLYTLLCGFPPFYDESINVLTEKVARGYYTFLSPWWDDISHTAKDLITHLLCVDPAQRYTIDEFLAHPWCTASPAPPPPPTPYIYNNPPPTAGLSAGLRPLDSPLLTAVRGGREGRSPGIATLKEAFDITYAVHRMEEEGARRRKYNGRGGAGARGFLGGLNEDDEDEDGEEGEDERELSKSAGAHVSPRRVQGQGEWDVHEGRAGTRAPRNNANERGRGGGAKTFELSIGDATLLGRRHKKVGLSPLAGKPVIGDQLNMEGLKVDGGESRLPPGSPMHL